jgi:hypothetical protein
MMTIVRWGALVLFALGLLPGCYGSRNQTKDGQSHWLRTCSEQSDCRTNELCACGVCTVACEASSVCGARSACEGVGERSACAGALAGVTDVCLASCSREEDCAAFGLTCDAGACVGAVIPSADGSVSRDGAVVQAPDGSASDGLQRFDTSEGELACNELTERHSALLSGLWSAHRVCATERDCGCELAVTRCRSMCVRAISRIELNRFAQRVASFEEDYCRDPDLPSDCVGETGVDELGCAPCVATCVEGECREVSRDPCGDELVCNGDLLCHIDQTCLARSMGDDNGIATLAIARELGDRGSSFQGIASFVVTGEAVIWLDAGTFDETGTHRNDAIVYSMALDDPTPQILAEGMAAGVAGMAFDDTNVYFTAVDGICSLPLDGSAPPFHLVERLELEQSQWVLSGGFIYYVNTARDGFLHRVSVDGSEDIVYFDMADPLRGIAAYGDRVYAELFTPGEADSYLLELRNDTDVPATVASSFRAEFDSGPLLVGGSVLLADVGERSGVQALDLDSGRFYTLAADAWLDQRSASDTHLYYAEVANSGMSDMPDYFIGRTAISNDESERLRRATGPVGHVVASGAFLYWVEDRRLLRKPL